MEPVVFSRVCSVEREIHGDSGYYWSNRGRHFMSRLVVQRTVAGACFFEKGKVRQPVPAGYAMLFTYDDDSAYGYPEDATEPYELIYLNLLPSSSVEPLFNAVRKEFGPVVRMAEGGEACACLSEILERYDAHSFRDSLHESELLARLFHTIHREQTAERTSGDPVALAHDLIQTRFRSQMNLKTLAVRCGISREHLIRRFRERYDTSPAVMLRSLRLKHARQVLTFSQMSVEAIAHDCGFTSSNSFCRAFRRELGCSPLEERTRAMQPKIGKQKTTAAT